MLRCQDAGDIDAAMSVYRAASDALPKCLFINFAHADFLERAKKVDDAREVYENLRAVAGCALVDIRLQQFMRRTHGVDAAREVRLIAQHGEGGQGDRIYILVYGDDART